MDDGVDCRNHLRRARAPPPKLDDKEASNELLRIYNDWLKEFCSHYPDRQLGLALPALRRSSTRR